MKENTKTILPFLLFVGLIISYKSYPIVTLMIYVLYLIYFVYEAIQYKNNDNTKEYKLSVLKSVALVSITVVLISKIIKG